MQSYYSRNAFLEHNLLLFVQKDHLFKSLSVKGTFVSLFTVTEVYDLEFLLMFKKMNILTREIRWNTGI